MMIMIRMMMMMLEYCDDVAFFECATVSDDDLPQKRAQEENSQRAYLSLFS